jgi:hypothetical protein
MDRLELVKFLLSADIKKLHTHFSELRDYERKCRELATEIGKELGVKFDEYGMLIKDQDWESIKKKMQEDCKKEDEQHQVENDVEEEKSDKSPKKKTK